MIYMRVFNIAINEAASYVYANAHLVTCPKKKVCFVSFHILTVTSVFIL